MTDLPRTVLRITGSDQSTFLQGLITNDIGKLAQGAVYAALLTPQGKYLADFFLIPDGDSILLDVAQPLAPMLMQRLTMYRLRSDVQITETDITVTRGLGPAPDGAFADPRHPDMGWRGYHGQADQDGINWLAHRLTLGIPESTIDLTPDSYVLESRFEALNGVDFRKGCYVGQEVTARMKHKTELRKGLAVVTLSVEAPIGTEITSGGKPVGTLLSNTGGLGLAYLRFDRADGPMQAGDATVTWQTGNT